jgi:hypothetical protein
MSAELTARRTAAAAALADYRGNDDMDAIDRALWAERLAAELDGLLAAIDAEGAQ